jgi:hypothetical protein
MPDATFPTLASLEFLPYVDETGQLPDSLSGKVGVYGIFDADRTLQFIGYSRDIFLSLRQHIVRQPLSCYWVKVETIDRPNRTLLDNIRAAWISENGPTPPGNADDAAKWNEPIAVQSLMTAEERANYANPVHDEMTQVKILKNVARRVEAEILAVLKARGVKADLRFNPKLKEEGLLDLKS